MASKDLKAGRVGVIRSASAVSSFSNSVERSCKRKSLQRVSYRHRACSLLLVHPLEQPILFSRRQGGRRPETQKSSLKFQTDRLLQGTSSDMQLRRDQELTD